jgi:sec-independent protein translocase protein TatC
MLLLATPISLLYLAACAISWYNDRRRQRTGTTRPGGSPDTEASPIDLAPAPLDAPDDISVSRP